MRSSNKIVGWTLFVILTSPGFLHAQGNSPQEIQNSCAKSVQGFYNRFVGKGPKYPGAVLSPELRRQLEEDKANNQDDSGNIVGLDFDPIAAGNDICDRYKVGKVVRKGNRYLVEVYCVWGNKKDENLKMMHEVMFSRGRWMIMNIHYYRYEKGEPPSHGDLLSYLKTLREERQKTPGEKIKKETTK